LRAEHKADRARYLTIVDYTKPSNSRRMYVIDLVNNRIVDQTWVAHGMGTDGRSGPGKDGFGSNPPISNEPGSKLSSEGFVITQQVYSGKYGSSLRLTGLEPGNSHISDRGIVIHDWDRRSLVPYSKKDFTNALQSLDSAGGGTDISKNIILTRLTSGEAVPYMPATEGCLGVHPGPARIRDERGEPKSVPSGSEYLRTTLSGGSILFNYSGPEQKSPYY